jgi:hypothetical protein
MMKSPSSYQYIMPTWSEEELLSVDSNRTEWYDRFTLFVLWRGNDLTPQQRLHTPLIFTGPRVSEWFFKYGWGYTDDDEMSYFLVHINPRWSAEKNDFLYKNSKTYRLASDEIFKKFESLASKEWITEAENYFNEGTAIKHYGVENAGFLFQKIVLWLKPLSGKFLKMDSLPSVDPFYPKFSFRVPNVQLLAHDWRESRTLKPGVLYQPKISNMESGNAFCMITMGNTILVVFQIAVAEHCAVKAKGFEAIVQAIAPHVRQKLTQKMLCFVTPLHSKLCTVQSYHNDDETVSEILPAEVNDFQRYVVNYDI